MEFDFSIYTAYSYILSLFLKKKNIALLSYVYILFNIFVMW